jgi:cobalt/nickel transport system permease protein
MADIRSKTTELYSLELLSGGTSLVHRLHPAVKLIAAVTFLVTVISFDRHTLGRLLPYFLDPSVLISLGELPLPLLFRRACIALPFCLFAGLSNLIIERNAAFYLGSLPVSFGFISLWTLLARTLLCVSAVLILIATTPWGALSAQLRRFHVPPIFVTLLEICYRYLGVLLAEAASMYTAYLFRGTGGRGIAMSHMGSFIGRLFLRSTDRAERIYAAMKCRGYTMENRASPALPLKAGDITFLVLACGSCILFRYIDIPRLVGSGISRVLSL